MLGDVFVIEIGQAEVEQDVHHQREIEQGGKFPVTDVSDLELNLGLNAKNPERLDEQVENEQDGQVEYELFLLYQSRQR